LAPEEAGSPNRKWWDQLVYMRGMIKKNQKCPSRDEREKERRNRRKFLKEKRKIL